MDWADLFVVPEDWIKEETRADQLAERITFELVQGIIDILNRRSPLVRYELDASTVRGIRTAINDLISTEIAQ